MELIREKLLHIERVSADPEKRELASSLIAEMDSKIGLYRIGEEIEAQQIGAPWKKGIVMAVVYSNNNYYIEEPELVRKIQQKSRIDEIAEEAAEKFRLGVSGSTNIQDLVKSAIIKDREEREANR